MQNQRIRFKRNYRVLKQFGDYDFILTLDEGVKLPAQAFSDCFLAVMLEEDREDLIVAKIAAQLGLPAATVAGFIGQMLAKNVLERFDPTSPLRHERYDRQLLFWDTVQPTAVFEENYERQERLAKAHVAVIGIGGIGNYFALSLAASGIGRISLVDNDKVELSNLSRQKDIGLPKAVAAKLRLLQVNPDCRFEAYQEMIDSKPALRSLLERIAPVDYLILSADQAIELPNWASELRKEFDFKAVKCGYMGYQGLVGPIFGPETVGYEEMFKSWAGLIEQQDATVHAFNARHTAPSSSASNAILANIACLEVLKDISGTGHVNLMGRRLLFNLRTLESTWG
jgi:molybdopterin/thiamine biosynthesis adenylyltransferase